MKKIKRILAIVLVMATVCAYMALPAAAVIGFTGSDSDSGSGLGIHWRVSLVADGKDVTAQLYISKNPSGYVPASLFGKIDMTIKTSDNNEHFHTASSSELIETSLTVTETVPIGTMDIEEITCVFTPNGEDPVTLELNA